MLTAVHWQAGVLAAMLLVPSIALAQNPSVVPAARAAAVHRDLPYLFTLRERSAARQQSLDLFLPNVAAGGKPPLIVFVHGGFWRESDESYGVGAALAQALLPHGVAVALVRYPLAPAQPFAAQPDHVARAIAHLHRVADNHGYDAKRVYLMGHNTGAHLAALVALDARYLRDAGAPPSALAGVVAVSGIYDLSAAGPVASKLKELVIPVFGSDAQTHRNASPVTHVRRGPPFLILSAEEDLAGFQVDARRFAARLRAAGNAEVQEIVLQGVDHLRIMDMRAKRSLMRDLVLSALGLGAVSAPTDTVLRARRVWQEPPLSTASFWAKPELVRPYPMDARFASAFDKIYDAPGRFDLKSYPLERFHAIDLVRYLRAQPREKIGSGDYLVLTNVRQEKVFWRLSEIERYQPVIVVGLDDERNLFRLSTFYHNRRAYSWTDETTALSVKSLGAFIYFLKEPPEHFNAPTTATYSLTGESFRLMEHDPLAAMKDLPEDVRSVLYHRNACLSCHSFRGTDVRAGHLRALDAKPQGGFALPLESYPPEVWRQFMFEHPKSAAAIGVRSNEVAQPAAGQLFDIVVKEREKKPQPSGLKPQQ